MSTTPDSDLKAADAINDDVFQYDGSERDAMSDQRRTDTTPPTEGRPMSSNDEELKKDEDVLAIYVAARENHSKWLDIPPGKRDDEADRQCELAGHAHSRACAIFDRRCRERAPEWLAEIRRLRAIVDKLPKNVNGDFVVRGLTQYVITNQSAAESGVVLEVFDADEGANVLLDFGDTKESWPIDELYSTESAARASAQPASTASTKAVNP